MAPAAGTLRHPFGRLVVGVGGDRLPLEDIRMAQHLYGPSPELVDGGGTDLHLVDQPVPGTITIDCASCVMRDTPTCEDCVVTFLCDREPTDAVLLDLTERQALRRLAQAGLAPSLRHVGR